MDLKRRRFGYHDLEEVLIGESVVDRLWSLLTGIECPLQVANQGCFRMQLSTVQ
ncbi:hypothetical protein [Streptomyces aureocirculatus]|uniref:hypothetical protein n=1 Tax=Streptomyces aureocirculatus TaxID=67275 RepID=UPI0012FEDA64|nr:hypothetical protein [Streptomyces aureocirculatus]